MEIISEAKAFGGIQGVYRHGSTSTGTDMTFSVYVPPHTPGAKLPVLWYLSGLTCTHANVTEKGDFRRACAELGIVFVAPDTGPRGDGVADDPNEAYDFGLGAGFYVDATQAPFSKHYKMKTYIEDELPALIAKSFPADMTAQGITGHSMGGHGALTIGLHNPQTFKSISAFSPIVAPSQVPWGEKALGGYLGDDRAAWAKHDAVELIKAGHNAPGGILVDQGLDDNFFKEQLKTHLLDAACETAGIDLQTRYHAGYDHSYYFISTFMRDHIVWHAERLRR